VATLVTDLESAAYPALDSLISRVNASNLERVRRVKNRMVRLNTRVETIRAVLEKYLDNDDDMEDLNLTGKQCATGKGRGCLREQLTFRARTCTLPPLHPPLASAQPATQRLSS